MFVSIIFLLIFIALVTVLIYVADVIGFIPTIVLLVIAFIIAIIKNKKPERTRHYTDSYNYDGYQSWLEDNQPNPHDDINPH